MLADMRGSAGISQPLLSVEGFFIFSSAIKAASLSSVLVLPPPNLSKKSSNTPYWCWLSRWVRRDPVGCFRLPCWLHPCIHATSSLPVSLHSSLACSLHSHHWPSSYSSQRCSPSWIGDLTEGYLCMQSQTITLQTVRRYGTSQCGQYRYRYELTYELTKVLTQWYIGFNILLLLF